MRTTRGRSHRPSFRILLVRSPAFLLSHGQLRDLEVGHRSRSTEGIRRFEGAGAALCAVCGRLTVESMSRLRLPLKGSCHLECVCVVTLNCMNRCAALLKTSLPQGGATQRIVRLNARSNTTRVRRLFIQYSSVTDEPQFIAFRVLTAFSCQS